MNTYQVKLNDGSVQYIRADGYYRPFSYYTSVERAFADYYTFYKEVPRIPGILGMIFGGIYTETREVARVHINDVVSVTEVLDAQ